MTQSIETLVERLRGLDPSHVLKLEAATALESQAARIAELEAERSTWISRALKSETLVASTHKHAVEHTNCRTEGSCHICDGGLFVCADCGAAEQQAAECICPADAKRIEVLETRLCAIGPENDRLRAALAVSKDPCVYCSLPADKMAECQYGFPGCARADDSMGCPELGASMERDMLCARLLEAEEVIRPFAEFADVLEGRCASALWESPTNMPIPADRLRAARRWLDASEPTAVLNVEKGE